MTTGKGMAEKAVDSETMAVGAIIKSLIVKTITGRSIAGNINPSMDTEAIMLERQKTAARKTTKREYRQRIINSYRKLRQIEGYLPQFFSAFGKKGDKGMNDCSYRNGSQSKRDQYYSDKR